MVELQDTVAVPEFVILLGVIGAQPRLAGTVSARITVPAKPLTAETVMVEIADPPDGLALGEVAEMMKSVTATTTVAELVRVPLVPFMVTVYVPLVVEFTVKVDVAVPPLVKVMLVALRIALGPGGETVVERLTVPVKPFTLETVMVEGPEDPALTDRLVGLGARLKLAGPSGMSLVNLTLTGAKVPSLYSRSSVALDPVGLMLVTWLSDAVFNHMMVAFQDPPEGSRM